MARETPSYTPDDLRNTFEGTLPRADGTPMGHLTQAMFDCYDLIDWERGIDERGIRGIVGSTATAIQYAHLRTGKEQEFLEHFEIESSEEWKDVINNVLHDQEMSTVFYENLGRPIVTASPLRGVPLQSILRHRFGGKRTKGGDLGAGPHITLPLLNSDRYRTASFPNKEKIAQFAEKDVNIGLGIGIDIQDGRKDVDWVKASLWPKRDFIPLVEDVDNLFKEVRSKVGFPFEIADLRDTDTCVAIIQKYTQGEKLDFAVSSFVKYFFGKRKNPAHQEFRSLIGKIVKEGGLWIDTDTERGMYKFPYVKVHQIRNGVPMYIDSPFRLWDQNHIAQVRESYFNRSW